MKVRITLTDEMLGTASGNPDVHREFIASRSNDADKMAEEMEHLPASELEAKAKTVFARDESGAPCLFDYQVKGFVKEAMGALLELADGETKVGKTKLSKFTFKRLVDNYVFVTPRVIRLCDAVGPDCVRPLRAETMRGERVALATSETVPVGTAFECKLTVLAPSLRPLVRQCLDYGAHKGLGQWRNSGKGRFGWEEVAE